MGIPRTAFVRASVAAVTVCALCLLLLSIGVFGGRYVMWKVRVAEPVIALTFDDGPHPEFTARVLEELKARDVKATFFVVGEHAEQNPELVRRMIEGGHELGNHTHSHCQVGEIDSAALLEEIDACERAIAAAGGDTTRWYRPPRGDLPFAHVWAVLKGGRRVAMWSRCLESSTYKDPIVLAGALEPGDVVLVHDGGLDRTWSVEALPKLLDATLARGFSFVTLSELDAMSSTPALAGAPRPRP